MNDNELNELGNSDNWDWEKTETKSGRQSRRTIVSVGFLRPDFEKVSRFAEKCGWNVSAFVRNAALEKIAKIETESSLLNFMGPSTAATPLAPSTKVRFGDNTTKGVIDMDPGRTEVLQVPVLILY